MAIKSYKVLDQAGQTRCFNGRGAILKSVSCKNHFETIIMRKKKYIVLLYDLLVKTKNTIKSKK